MLELYQKKAGVVSLIGSLGNIAFTVSEDSVRTFSDLNFQRQATFAEHKILNGPGLIEFTGDNAASCSLKISLHEVLGINPADELENLRKNFLDHEVLSLMLGDKVLGEWVIESMTENFQTIGAKGNIIAVEVSLNLKEYILE